MRFQQRHAGHQRGTRRRRRRVEIQPRFHRETRARERRWKHEHRRRRGCASGRRGRWPGQGRELRLSRRRQHAHV